MVRLFRMFLAMLLLTCLLSSGQNTASNGPAPKPVVVVEWVVEAGQRLWIVRASQEQQVTEREPSPSILGSLTPVE